MKIKFGILFFAVSTLASCTLTTNTEKKSGALFNSIDIQVKEEIQNSLPVRASNIVIEKQLLFDKYTLADVYPYRDTTRVFQWDKVKESLAHLENLLKRHSYWGILQNYKNQKGIAPLVKEYHKNAYDRIADSFDVDRIQSVPLYSLKDTVTPERYGRDGTFIKYLDSVGSFIKVEAAFFDGEWLVPSKYVKRISDTVRFDKTIFVDVTNQNITTLEKKDSIWFVRSMNPATTGLHRPPHKEETPLGIFVLQDKKSQMFYLKDGTDEIDGFAPWASRFCNGGYIHGIPIKSPSTDLIEYSSSLGTTPRSHMCIRNATSHAKFVYDWAPRERSLVFVLK